MIEGALVVCPYEAVRTMAVRLADLDQARGAVLFEIGPDVGALWLVRVQVGSRRVGADERTPLLPAAPEDPEDPERRAARLALRLKSDVEALQLAGCPVEAVAAAARKGEIRALDRDPPYEAKAPAVASALRTIREGLALALYRRVNSAFRELVLDGAEVSSLLDMSTASWARAALPPAPEGTG